MNILHNKFFEKKLKIFVMQDLTQAYSHVVNDEVFDQTCDTLDSVYESFGVDKLSEKTV